MPVSQKASFSTAIFQPYVLVATFVIYTFLACVMFYVGKSIVMERKIYKNLVEIFVLLYGMMITHPLPRLPKSRPLRFFILVWALFCLHWYSAFTTKLYSNLTQMRHHNEVIFLCNHMYDHGLNIHNLKKKKLRLKNLVILLIMD